MKSDEKSCHPTSRRGIKLFCDDVRCSFFSTTNFYSAQLLRTAKNGCSLSTNAEKILHCTIAYCATTLMFYFQLFILYFHIHFRAAKNSYFTLTVQTWWFYKVLKMGFFVLGVAQFTFHAMKPCKKDISIPY